MGWVTRCGVMRLGCHHGPAGQHNPTWSVTEEAPAAEAMRDRGGDGGWVAKEEEVVATAKKEVTVAEATMSY